MKPFQFLPKDPEIWRGHYERIPGDTTTFHCDINGKVFVRWDDLETEDRLTSKALDFGEITELGQAVNDIKFQHNGSGGGSFLINEFGNVIVSSSNGLNHYIGDVKGHIYFKDPDQNRFFTLDSISKHNRGDRWERPYVGNMFHQATDGQIYRKIFLENEIHKQILDVYPSIAEDLIAIRGSNGCRFIVNCHGVVLTKVQGLYGWEPCYVGKIDFQEWYQDGLSNYGSKARQSNNEHPTTSSAVWPPIQETSDIESGYVSKKEEDEVNLASDHEYWDFDEDEEADGEDEDHNEDHPEEEEEWGLKKEGNDDDDEYWDFDEDEDEEKNETEGLDNQGEETRKRIGMTIPIL